MIWDPTPLAVGGLAVTAFVGYAAVLAWRSGDAPGARTITVLLAVLTVGSFVYAVMFGLTTAPEQATLFGVSFAFGTFVAPLWLLFTLEYTDAVDWRERRAWTLVLVEPLVVAPLAATNRVHGLLWRVEGLASAPRVVLLDLQPLYRVHMSYMYLLFAAGLGLLVVRLGGVAHVRSRQTWTLVLASVPAALTSIGFTFRLPIGPLAPVVDPTPFLAAVGGGVFALSAYKFDLIDRSAVARDNALEQMGDGLLVLDTDGRVVEVNGVARRVLDPAPEVGEPVAAEPLASADIGEANGERPDSVETVGTVETAVDGRERTYDVAHSPVRDHRGGVVGHAVALRDVTDRDRYRQRLEVANRVYRHNVRTRLNVIRGWVEQIGRESTNGEAVGKVLEATDDLISLSEKTRAMVRLDDATDGSHADVVDHVGHLVDDLRDRYPDATVEYAAVDGPARVANPNLVEVAVENVVENAVEHNDALEPWVGITVERSPDAVEIRVADDGPGIPEAEREVIAAGTETPLRHGSGIGLWLVHWSVTTLGGDVRFETRDHRGSVVTLTVPAEWGPGDGASEADPET